MPERVLHVTSEFPPVHLGGLGTAVRGLTAASLRAGLTVGVLLVDGCSLAGDGRGDGELGDHPPSPGHPLGRALPYGLRPPGRGSTGATSALTGAPPYGAYGTGRRRAAAGGGPPTLRSPRALETEPHGITVRPVSWDDHLEIGVPLAAAWRPDVVHLHAPWLWRLASAVRERTGSPVVYTVHSLAIAERDIGGQPASWMFHGPVQEEAIGGADHLIAVSRSEQEVLTRYYPTARGRTSVVGNGIDPAEWAGAHTSRAADGSPVILYAGRLDVRKGTADLIAAMPQVLERFPGARLVIVGSDHSGSPADLAERWLPWGARSSPSIRFLGWLGPAELGRWYRRADILVVPSRYEPFGMAVLEGMLHGLAVVAAAAGGPAEILDHGRTGYLVPPGDTGSLASALVRLLERPGLRARLGAAAAREARRAWGWDRPVEEIRRLYRRVQRTR